MKHWQVLLTAIVLSSSVLVGGAASSGADVGSSVQHATTGPAALTKALAAIENSSRYRQSDWGYSVIDEKSGDVVASQNDQKMFDPGSTMKIYAIATALRQYGSNYKFHTPVYRQGTVDSGTLNGNLVLVASGDLSFGLREQPNGTLYYENLPQLDHSYANTGLPDAVEPPGNPLAGLEQLAAMVRASGIVQVNGDVAIDDRLFTSYNGFPDGLVSPIWVNENYVDVLATPGKVGQPASIEWRPMTASYTVDNHVITVESSKQTSLTITEPTPGTLVVTGQIAAGSKPTLRVQLVDDPSAFARTAFIEALQRAGVTVTAAPTGANPEAVLPAKGSYKPADKLGEHVSASMAQFANLLLKVSYDRASDLMTCLSAVKAGSVDCTQGLEAETKTTTDLGIPATSVYPFDGAGSDDQDRSTPAAFAQFLRRARSKPYGKALFDALPVLGKSGTTANVLPKSPAAGHVHLKTGNRVGGLDPDNLILFGNSLAGYITTKTGRHLTFMIAVGNVPLTSAAEFFDVTNDQARMVEAIQQSL